MMASQPVIETLHAAGYDFFAGVPCARLNPLFNAAIDHAPSSYLAAVNAGDALAIAAGRALAGRRAAALLPNAALGDALAPLISLNSAYRLPVLLIVSWRGAPDTDDEREYEAFGRITPDLLEDMAVGWETFPEDADALDEALQRAQRHMDETGRPYALVLKTDAFASAPLNNAESPTQSRGAITFRPAPPKRPQLGRREALAHLVERTDPGDSVIIASTGYAGRVLQAIDDRANRFYLIGASGCAPLLGLGLALTRPDLRVIAVDGDGAALLRLRAMATLAAYGPTNLCHLVLDNGMHESTGGQATVSSGLSFAAVAAATGYRTTYEGHDCSVIDRMLAGSSRGPAFAHLHIAPGVEGAPPAPLAESPEAISRRVRAHIGSC